MRVSLVKKYNLVNLWNLEPGAFLSGRHHCHYFSLMLIFPILISQEKVRKCVSRKKRKKEKICFHSLQKFLNFVISLLVSLFLNVYLFIFERERESTRMSRGGAGWEGETENPRQIPHCQCKAWLEPTNHDIMTWAEIKSQTLNRLRHPGTPSLFSC